MTRCIQNFNLRENWIKLFNKLGLVGDIFWHCHQQQPRKLRSFLREPWEIGYLPKTTHHISISNSNKTRQIKSHSFILHYRLTYYTLNTMSQTICEGWRDFLFSVFFFLFPKMWCHIRFLFRKNVKLCEQKSQQQYLLSFGKKNSSCKKERKNFFHRKQQKCKKNFSTWNIFLNIFMHKKR